MLKKLFALLGGSTGPAPSKAEPAFSLAKQTLLRQIAARSKSDPLIGAKIGSKEITQRLVAAMKTERGVHIESLLCAVGSLAGYSCQAAMRAQVVAHALPGSGVLTSVEAKDGTTYFFGDYLNKPLVESQYSVWSIAGGGAQQAGCTKLLDVSEIFEGVRNSVF
jgi:hypothetical protein